MPKSALKHGCQIRLAVSGDAARIGFVHVACWRETYAGIFPRKYLYQFNVKEQQEFWLGVIGSSSDVFVAERDGENHRLCKWWQKPKP